MKIIVDDEEVLEIPLLRRPVLTESPKIVTPEIVGRKPGGSNKTVLEKTLIGIDGALSDIPQNQLARIHNVTQAEVSIHSRAVDRTNVDTQKTDEELKTVINQAKYKIADVATTKLMSALNLFKPEYLDQKDLPVAAKNMALIVEKVSQNFQGDGAGNVNFIVYAPRTRAEDTFDVIEVSE